MTCPQCACELDPGDNANYVLCDICGFEGHPVECYGERDEDNSDEETV